MLPTHEILSRLGPDHGLSLASHPRAFGLDYAWTLAEWRARFTRHGTPSPCSASTNAFAGCGNITCAIAGPGFRAGIIDVRQYSFARSDLNRLPDFICALQRRLCGMDRHPSVTLALRRPRRTQAT